MIILISLIYLTIIAVMEATIFSGPGWLLIKFPVYFFAAMIFQLLLSIPIRKQFGQEMVGKPWFLVLLGLALSISAVM